MSAPDDRLRALAGAAAIASIVIAASVAPRAHRADAPIACVDAEPWMAEALPGVGPAGRDAALSALRDGDPERLPPRAREAARAWFAFPAQPTSSGTPASSASQQRRTWRKHASKPSSGP